MKEDIYSMIVALIKEHQTWLDVLDCDTKEEFVTVSGYEMKRTRCRILRLVSKYNTRQSYKGQIFTIPEFRLNNAIKSMKRNPGFNNRLGKKRLSINDVNSLIHGATHGLINLELE